VDLAAVCDTVLTVEIDPNGTAKVAVVFAGDSCILVLVLSQGAVVQKAFWFLWKDRTDREDA
jgi:hypothetical protein